MPDIFDTCQHHAPLRSLKALQDEIDALRQQVEWQATRIEYLSSRVRLLEGQPMPWRLVPIPVPAPATSDPLPSRPIITCGPSGRAEDIWGSCESPIRWGGTD